MKPDTFFNLDAFEHRELFVLDQYVWEALKRLKKYIDSKSLGKIECDLPDSVHLVNPELISIGEGSTIEPGIYIEGPCIIGKNCEIRHSAYLRPYVLTGNGCVIGHSSEVKHSIMLDGAKAPHFNYVGDSILGNDVNIGAGLICANFRLDHREVIVRYEGEKIPTGLKKFGAIIGDRSQLGCNCVTSPGVLLGKEIMVAPCKNIKANLLKSRPLLQTLRKE